MVQAADLGQFDDLAHGWRVDRSRLGRVFAQRQMGSRPMVVAEIGFQDPVQVLLAEDDDVVEAISPYGTHKPFGIWILPRKPWCGEYLLDADVMNTTAELVAEDAVSVADQVPGRRVLGEGFDDLLAGPGGARKLGDVEVKNTAAVVGEDEEDVEDAEGGRGDREEVARRRIPGLTDGNGRCGRGVCEPVRSIQLCANAELV
jgi:hypothetical protein